MKRNRGRMLLWAGILAIYFAAAITASNAASSEPQHKSSSPSEPQKPHDTEHQLAEASKEAAGHAEEHDEHAKYKYSGSVRLLAEKTGMSVQAAYWTSIALNFLIVLGAIVWLVRKKAPGLFRERTSVIQKGIEEARRASQEAQRRLTDIEGRLAQLDDEIAGIESNAETQARDEEARLRAAVEDEKKNIVRSAEQEIARATNNARRELKIYTTELAVGLAEKKIKIDAATDAEILREFVEQLDTDGASRRNT